MKEYKKAEDFDIKTPTCVTIGTFDGVHVGHRKIIDQLIRSSKKNNYESTLLTFFPHPRMVLQKESGIKLIDTIAERKMILDSTGIDNLIVHPFTKEFSRLSAREYVESILVEKLNAKRVIIGYDHHFGRNRRADIKDMKRFGKEYGFAVEEISEQDINEVAVSSTKIRKALEAGDMEKANEYLGAPFMLTGKIIKGKEMGKQLGYPTANLHIEEDYKIIPKNGVYIASSLLDGKRIFGMMSIGTNPTISSGNPRSIETHFFNTDENLYGKVMQIDILVKIREEKRFDSLKELSHAMDKDHEYSKRYIDKNHRSINKYFN